MVSSFLHLTGSDTVLTIVDYESLNMYIAIPKTTTIKQKYIAKN